MGGGKPTELMDFIGEIEAALGRKATLNMLPMQPGDVVATEADAKLLAALIGEAQVTPLSVGIPRAIDWFLGKAD